MFLRHFLLIALFAVNYLWSVGSVRCFKFIGTGFVIVEVFYGILINTVSGFNTNALAFSMPEFNWCTLCKSSKVTTIWTKLWQGKIHPIVELQLRFNYSKSSCALFVALSPMQTAYSFF